MSDRYIFRYIIILVLIVSLLLSGAALLLKPYQDMNKKNEQRINILKAAGIIGVDKHNAEQLFNQHCTATHDGELPYYIIDDKVTVIPMQGNGLWGPIWGYIGLSEDYQTVVGAVFDHKSETPGLGAEITTEGFQSQFSGREMKDYSVEVDAIAGATRTSDRVKDMIKNTLEAYKPVFERHE